ncbi:hypothetical protein BDP81DRAFT_401808 [Colletotrichum phormii]|uniref:Uncharacterized protein n=1 Tax=Colletotrichum phormii TaxID=359342 RepID=A0AAJ0ENU4_9PEZI|nr:uncharacterized protein BDP81DRAFT_401808 [Colletotrichum phormii]KAK1655803.1 hypothetical protein BDP81DRAFT_401808 [Colletotrichum phormii]
MSRYQATEAAGREGCRIGELGLAALPLHPSHASQVTTFPSSWSHFGRALVDLSSLVFSCRYPTVCGYPLRSFREQKV